MNCPNCRTRNRPDANFCKHCGILLASNCPRCQAPVQENAKYCDHCGLPFATQIPQGWWFPSQVVPGPAVAIPASPVVGPRPQLEQLISAEVRAKLDSARAEQSMVGERRVVTMLFCDVKGSTAAAEHLDPEDWSEIINQAFEYMIRPVYQFEGTVARLMGDGILAFFGAPIAHEDDAQRAVLAGLEIVDRFAPYREQVLARWEIDFDVRVGINTGLVMVGPVGSDLQMEYTALGDAINLAARMEQTAQPGTVQISEYTYRLVAPLFEFEDLGLVEIKGKDQPVHTYRPLQRKAVTGRLRGIERSHEPLIGRERELERLTAVAEGVSRGVGRIVFLIGDPGLGKSRLIEELRLQYDGHKTTEASHPSSFIHPTWYEIAAPSYETEQPYGLFQRLMRRVIGATANDSSEVLRELLGALVEEMPADDRIDARKAFGSLFGLVSLDGSPPLEGEQFKRQLFRVMKAFWERRTGERPMILVLDDLHWADPASVELLEHLFRLTDDVPLLFICATRPERRAPGWRLRQLAEQQFPHRYTEINVRPLTAEDSSRLVDHMQMPANLPPELRTRILEKTEGNPFFIEEVMRSLGASKLEGGDHTGVASIASADGTDIHIPDNVQSLLTARIDRLQEDVRRTLQLAALIGRSFYYRVLQRIAAHQLEEHLPEHLNVLQHMDLIREIARQPELEYSFRHALTQEAAYNTILLRQRREFHRRVGEVIETLFSDQTAEMAPTLAHHFHQAQVFEKALQYHTLAGDVAYRLYAITEAISQYTQAFDLLEKVETSSEDTNHLYNRLGRSLELASRFGEALQIYKKMEAAAQTRADQLLELSALIAQSIIYSNVNDQRNPERGEELSRRALSLARELKDEASEAKILWNLLNVLRFSERIDEAVDVGERSLELAGRLALPEQRAIVGNDLSIPLMAAGQPGRAREVLQEARELWRELGNQPMLADSLATGSMLHSFMGDFEESIAFSDEAFQISNAIQNAWGQSYSRMAVGNVYWQRGDPARAVEMLETSRRYGEQASFAVAGAWTRCYQARIYGRLGQIERGLELAQAAVSHAEQYVPPWQVLTQSVLAQLFLLAGNLEKTAELLQDCEACHPSAWGRFLAIFQLDEPAVQIALARGDPARAVGLAEEMMAKIRRFDYRIYLPDALYLWSQALLAAGQADAAGRRLQEARREAEALNARWPLWQVLAAQAQIEREQENIAVAASLRAQAGEIVAYIADRAGSDQMRASFLARGDVQAVLREESRL